MWKFGAASTGEPARIEWYLREGYEPFTVTTDMPSDKIWFKKEVKEDEIPVKSKPIKGTSRGVTKTTKKHLIP